ncbi:MAG TPA: hypothetical protein VGJ26_19660, partial [Pirellulales bacterium]
RKCLEFLFLSTPPKIAQSYLDRLRDWDGAARCLDEANEAIDRSSGSQDILRLELLCARARVSLEKDNKEDALKVIENYLELSRRAFGPHDGKTMHGEVIKADTLARMGRKEEAEALADHVRQVLAEKHSPQFIAAVGFEQMCFIAVFGRDLDLVNAWKGMLRREEERVGAESSTLLVVLKQYAIALRKDGNEDEAKKADDRAAKINEKLRQLRQQIAADPECRFPWEG